MNGYTYLELIHLFRALFYETNVSFETDKEEEMFWIVFNENKYPDLTRTIMFHKGPNTTSIHSVYTISNNTESKSDHEFYSELREMLAKYEPETCAIFDEEFDGKY